MALETVGGHFLHPQRELHGRRSCSVEVVQFEMPLPGYDRLSVQGRIQQMLSKGNVDIWVRVDYSSVSSQPPLNDVQALFRFNSFLQGLTADPAFGRARGFIIGNEPNLTATPAWWVARCVYGFNSEPGDTNNAYQFITTVNPAMLMLAPALAPWSPAADGDLGQLAGDPAYVVPPDGRAGLMPWERYQGALAWRCYNNNFHVPYDQIKFCMHVYSNIQAAEVSGFPANEPAMDLRDATWHNAHNGSHVFDDLQYQLIWAAGGNPPPIVISEWNTFVNGQLTCDNYPAGLLVNLIRTYLRFKPNLLGFANFVDLNHAGTCATWQKTAVTGYLDTSGCLNDVQKERLRRWDTDFNVLLAEGW